MERVFWKGCCATTFLWAGARWGCAKMVGRRSGFLRASAVREGSSSCVPAEDLCT